jgi:hypothetical protein
LDDDAALAIDPSVEVAGRSAESYGLAFAAHSFHNGAAVGALALNPSAGPGEIEVIEARGASRVVIVVDESTRCEFYRAVVRIEDQSEPEFFDSVQFAFPSLRFAEGISFRRFDGDYRQLRDKVIEHLSGLNDKFREEFQRFNGMPGEVAAAVGLDMSPEGGTRQSPRLMALRDVTYRGRLYRCEWHTKLEPHRNRIHFHPGADGTDGCVLIGMFVDHLPT